MVGKITDNKKASCSLLPAIMGHSPWQTQNETVKKVRGYIAGEEDTWEGNEATGWGDRLEKTVLKEGCKRLGIKAKLNITTAAKHSTLPLEASLDGIGEGNGVVIEDSPAHEGYQNRHAIYVCGDTSIKLEGPGVLEAKVTRNRPEDFPALYRGPLQMQGQMMCTGYKWGALMVLYGGVELRIWVMTPHAKTVKAIEEAVLDFEKRILAKEPKWYDLASGADAAMVYSLGDQEEPIDLDAGDMAREYVALKDQIKEGQDALELMGAQFQSMMGNHTIARAGNYEIKWPVRNYKAQPEKVVPPKDARQVRAKTIAVKEKANG
jgi:predicted phage-related endonuclease